MHVGEFDRDRVEDLITITGLVSKYQVQDMANIEGINIAYIRQDGSRGNFSDSLLDNYFVKQNASFDYLIDLENKLVELAPGEIGLPLFYAKRAKLTPGDQIVIQQQGETFTYRIRSIIRDAQMGSSLSSSIRFLLHPGGFDEIYSRALRQESIIGVRLKDEKDMAEFERIYTDEVNQMPQNGVAISYSLIKLVNTIGDGLMSGVIIIVGMILIIISLITMRFTVLSTLEDEVREIGVLKAVGLSNRDVNGLYQLKYRIITLMACLLAAVASFGLAKVFMNNVALNFGLSKATPLSYALPFVAAGLIYLIVMFSLKQVLKVISKMNVLSALREGKILRSKDIRKQRSGRLSRSFAKPEMSLGLIDLKLNAKSWLVLFVVLFLCSTIILIPLNLYSTMSSPDFSRFLGASRNDVSVTLQYQPELEGLVSRLRETAKTDPDIEVVQEYRTFRGMVEGGNGWQAFLMETGDYTDFPIDMIEGRLPTDDQEMAVSLLNQEKYGLSIGDTFPVKLGEDILSFEIVGVYQDITNGGYTAKVVRQVDQDVLAYAFYMNLHQGRNQEAFVQRWSEEFKEAKVLPFEEMVSQTLGTITSSLLYALIAVFVLSLVIIGLIAVLYISLWMHKNYQEDATLLALGFTPMAMRRMYLVKNVVVILLGVMMGAALTLLLGESLMGAVFSFLGFGLVKMNFMIHPLWFILLGCLIPAGVALAGIFITTGKLKEVSIMNVGNV